MECVCSQRTPRKRPVRGKRGLRMPWEVPLFQFGILGPLRPHLVSPNTDFPIILPMHPIAGPPNLIQFFKRNSPLEFACAANNEKGRINNGGLMGWERPSGDSAGGKTGERTPSIHQLTLPKRQRYPHFNLPLRSKLIS